MGLHGNKDHGEHRTGVFLTEAPAPQRPPMSWDGSVGRLGGPFADQHVLGDVTPSLLPVPCPRHPQRTSGTQAGDQLPPQRTSAFDIERLVDL